MNKKKGIIFSITGIVLVLFALIGFTYGFFASIVSGNETSKKVTLKAGKSEVEFLDLSDEIVDEIIAPDYTNTKFFTVQNVGEVSANYFIYLVDVVNDFIRKEDIVYTLYRKEGNPDIEPENVDTTVTDFSGWETIASGQYPSAKAALKTEKETITTPNDYYIYAFKVHYINQPNIDQVDDVGHVFGGKIKIYGDEEAKDPFISLEETILANYGGKSSIQTLTPTVEFVEQSCDSYDDYYWLEDTSQTHTFGSELIYNSTTGEVELGGTTITCTIQDCIDNGNCDNYYAIEQTGVYVDGILAAYKITDFNDIGQYASGVTRIILQPSSDSVFSNITTSTDKGLYKGIDDYGDTYYFRGSPTNNYVKFGKWASTDTSGNANKDMYWRIIRINGDGSIRMIYDGVEGVQNGTAHTSSVGTSIFGYGYKYDELGEDYWLDGPIGYITTYEGIETLSEIKTYTENWYNNNLLTNYGNYIEDSIFCSETANSKINGMLSIAYDRLEIIKAPTFICSQASDKHTVSNTIGTTKLTYPVGLISVDEVAFAGGVINNNNTNYYLYTGEQHYTITPYGYEASTYNYIIGTNGEIDKYDPTYSNNVRPVINLKANVTYTGSGEYNDPYVITGLN